MANLSSLVHELRERIAASSSTPPNHHGDDDALEIRFRAVLPNLLHAYVVPSSKAKEREVIAVLKLLTHTAKNFPGVFYNGKPSAVLPVIGRILPFFAEPAFRSRHGVIFETVGSLLSLLRTGDRDAYRQFFMDSMLAVEDLLYVGSVCDKTKITESSKVYLKCFCKSFTGICDEPAQGALLSDLPACSKPANGYGVLINLTGKQRWQPFATWVIKLICKCITEGTLYVEGLINASFVSAACTLLCHGDADLHMACFDFARVIGAVMNSEIVPSEKLILSISTILSEEEEGLPVFRNTVYDSSMGSCLQALHSSCPDDIVKLTAADLVNVFPESVRRTKSPDLQAALCNAYIRIAKCCPPHIWRPESLIYLLCSSEACFELIDCFRAALSILGPEIAGEGTTNDCCMGLSTSSDNRYESLRVGEKRPAEDLGTSKKKRQKVDEDIFAFSSNFQDANKPICKCTFERKNEYVDCMRKSLFSFVEFLKPLGGKANSLKPEVSLTAISMLSIIFCIYPQTKLSVVIFRHIREWIHWICEQANQSSSISLDLSIFLEAVHSILLMESPLPMENKCFRNEDGADLMQIVLKLPWTHCIVSSESHPPWKMKCLSIQVLAKIGPTSQSGNGLEILDLGLHDEAEEVRIEAVASMPVMVLWSGCGILPHVFKRLLFLGKEKNEQVKKVIPLSLGYLACLSASCSGVADHSETECKLFLKKGNEKDNWSVDNLLRGFWCSKCDRRVVHNHELHSAVLHPPENCAIEFGLDCDFIHLQSLFFELLSDESSEEVQVACAGIIRRILMHVTADNLLQTRSRWIKCVEALLLHRKKAVREAFSTQISFFLEEPILNCLFLDREVSNKTKEQRFLDKIKHSLAAADDPEIFETLLESTAEIMIAFDIYSQSFLLSLILLVDQLDNPHVIVRMTASRLIHRSCYFHLKGGFGLILSRVVQIRNELYDYLSLRLLTRPNMVREFAESLLGVETEELVKKMIPVVLPKLVVTQQDNDQAVATLYELAKRLNTDMVQLIVTCLPKVLAFALYQTDGRELLSALQFYHAQTGSDNQEIFAAALPALLDELVCFIDEGDSDEANKRLARVPRMIKEVARILTGTEDLPVFLRNHFVGLLNSIDRKMLHVEDLSLQKQAMKRIEMLINMMGSYLSTYVPKLMVLLMHAIDKESLQGEGLSVLRFFIKQLVKVSPSSTKHVISQVFAALIPLLERDKENSSSNLNKIVEILEELVFENRDILKQHIHEFPPLPSIPSLSEVNSVIQEARGSMTLKDQMRDTVDGLNHENLNVRYMVACELRKLLNVRRDDITSVVTGEVGSDMEVLSSLATSLLRGCAEESRTLVGQRLKLVCADCLGALGAVDPAKVKGFSSQRFKIACSDDDLIFELIHKHLARAFRAAPDTIIQDSAALAIQELLKIAGCGGSLDENVTASMSETWKNKQPPNVSSGIKCIDNCNGMNGRGQRLWDRFSNYVKEIIAPCLTSRFQLPNVADSASAGPIYRPSMSFRRWIFFWIKKLTVHATGSRVGIFNACRGIVRHDMQTAIYLLPYLVLNAVCHGTEEARHGITEEILSVLDAAASEGSAAVNSVVSSGQGEVCIQAVFTLLDNLGQWVDDVEQEIALSQSLQLSNSKQPVSKLKDQNTNSSMDSEQLLLQCKYVSELLTAIPKVTLARASFRCQAYARSLLYFESRVLEKSGSFNPAAERSGIFEDEDVSFLMEIYSGLDEPDGLSGLACLRKSKSLQDQILINKKAGNWAEVLTSCEQALQMEPTSIQGHSDVLNCLLNMCHLQAMVTHVDGLISRIPQYKKTWCMQGVQAAWRLGRWDLMDEYLNGADEEGLLCSSSESNASFDMDVAKILQAMMKKDQFSVAEKIALSKQSLIAPLAAAGMDSYTRAYPFVVKLHMLRELEDFHALLAGESFLKKSFCLHESEFSKMVENWENRLRFTQPSLWAREPLLAFRRLVFGASGLRAQVANCWLQYAKLCRSAGHYETANRAILEAKGSGGSNVHMEKAKLLWSTRRSDGAIAELQQTLLNMPVEVIGSAAISSITSLSLVPLNPQPLLADTQTLNENRDIAKALLLYSRWIHYTGQKQKEDVITLYSRVRELQPKWEKGYFYMAKYCDEVFADARKRQEENPELGSLGCRMIPSTSATVVSTSLSSEKHWWSYLPDVLLFYAKGLHRGHKNLFQALPRLLTLWFEFGSFYQRSGLSSNKDMKNVQGKVLSIMRGCLKDLPTYQWLTVLPQLVSRICHQNVEIVRLVKCIITSVLRQYPQQALWIMAAVSKSTVPSRREAAAEIISAARRESNQGISGNNQFVQFATVIDHLIKLCFHGGHSKARTINLSTEFSALKRMMPLDIIMPIQQSLTVNLPTYDVNLTDLLPSDIFLTTDLPTIIGITDEAEILSSLQRPKKVVLLGSDGIERPFLCKPKDDLRKDARMMEFNAMINRLLSKCPESRRRKLYIRTFAVIPLTEDCGMVEWVPHTRGLRHILQDIYISCGKFDRQKTNPLIKRIYDQCQGKIPEDELLKNKILPMFPPAFHKWFLNTFSEPAAWFRARVAYAHTTAVWSMVGHIVGLGDRHGENILFDSTTGDCVHVDFSCLFDKGLQLEKPELVPFRLTQNMIDGLGITGYEGIFLKVCEITLSILRAHRETLMSVLETFIHDPLVEWTKSHKSSGVEVQNPHAQRAISNIEARLEGVVVGVGAAPSLPLAVEGQARRLIAEAVSHKNLGKMYIWWMPWF
ncbi:serine/threonine-protein kinase ATR [Cornus florida]|uniref:serine/threonine-protein kinase ATR n=1 Tax=Cornus florida TaxID=4283 RepID=UPI0028A05944|nr:serine/threonine-protein kinase ATR [Cornus florida]XP_059653896.1 serine/threonine-protein kinase ATR [Cornus florida]XP_059653897.1 serine/threonine-protein kinase ATR [Cornus florida]